MNPKTSPGATTPVTLSLPLGAQYRAIPLLISKECAKIVGFNEKECHAIGASVLTLFTQLATGENINSNNKINFQVDIKKYIH